MYLFRNISPKSVNPIRCFLHEGETSTKIWKGFQLLWVIGKDVRNLWIQSTSPDASTRDDEATNILTRVTVDVIDLWGREMRDLGGFRNSRWQAKWFEIYWNSGLSIFFPFVSLDTGVHSHIRWSSRTELPFLIRALKTWVRAKKLRKKNVGNIILDSDFVN